MEAIMHYIMHYIKTKIYIKNNYLWVIMCQYINMTVNCMCLFPHSSSRSIAAYNKLIAVDV